MSIYGGRVNSLPNDKDWFKFKAFADDKLNTVVMMISLFDGAENTVGKGENAGDQHFLLLPQCFPVFFIKVVKKSELCGTELQHFEFFFSFLHLTTAL